MPEPDERQPASRLAQAPWPLCLLAALLTRSPAYSQPCLLAALLTRSPAYSQPCFLAGAIERRKLVAAHLDEFWRQAAVMADPGADLRRIKPHHQRAALAGRHQFARRVIVIGGRMEPEHRALGDADMVARHDPGQQGARRQAWPVDDDMLTGRTRRLELANVGGHLAAW